MPFAGCSIRDILIRQAYQPYAAILLAGVWPIRSSPPAGRVRDRELYATAAPDRPC
jgi:hypothetical protein